MLTSAFQSIVCNLNIQVNSWGKIDKYIFRASISQPIDGSTNSKLLLLAASLARSAWQSLLLLGNDLVKIDIS